MQATVLLLIALGGLGCQNPGADIASIPPNVAQPAARPPADGPESRPAGPQPAIPSTEPVAPEIAPPMTISPYQPGNHDLYGVQDDDSFGNCLRDTLWSFVIGRSPDVPSAREIEAAYRAGFYSR